LLRPALVLVVLIVLVVLVVLIVGVVVIVVGVFVTLQIFYLGRMMACLLSSYSFISLNFLAL